MFKHTCIHQVNLTGSDGQVLKSSHALLSHALLSEDLRYVGIVNMICQLLSEICILAP